MTDMPWLDYRGETLQQLLAHAGAYRTDSLLCVIDEVLEAKEEEGAELTPEEKVIRAVESLQRQVNNGGFHQFFTNSSHKYAPIIVDSLTRIGAQQAAAISKVALDSLKLSEVSAGTIETAAQRAIAEDDQEVLAVLASCDQRYFAEVDLDEMLFAFVEANARQIQL